MTNPLPQERRSHSRSPRVHPLEVRLVAVARGLEATALVTDAHESGLGIQTRAELHVGEVVKIESRGPDSALGGGMHARAAVRWRRAILGGLHRAGLQFLPSDAAAGPAEPAESDYYEILQVNPKASVETIHRVYRILAQQFHPDNQETGDEQAFRQLVEAYKVLSDPEQRAAYDIRHASMLEARWRVFHSPAAAQGPASERRKRFGVLRALYTKRIQDARSPGATIFELEDLLGVPRDHLEFTLWYLKERGYITRGDNNRFQITAGGVDHIEALEEKQGRRGAPGEDHMLPAPGGPAAG